jgi:ubiquinone/menaquinone biosynthesis C-methylase UbiE
MSKKNKAAFETFAEEYSFWAWATNSPGERGYNEAISFLPTSPKRVLEAGCGSGVLTLKLANHVDSIVGVDISPSMIRLARVHQGRLEIKNVEFIVADLETLPFGKGTFDFIVSYIAVHCTRMEIVLPALTWLIKPGGRMVICDLVTSYPRLEASPLWQRLRVIRNVPNYIRSYNLRTMWRIVFFQMKPAWIRYVCDDKNRKFTPESFREIYSRFLPGCRFERNPKTPWRMAAFWEAPKANS